MTSEDREAMAGWVEDVREARRLHGAQQRTSAFVGDTQAPPVTCARCGTRSHPCVLWCQGCSHCDTVRGLS